MKKFFLVVSLVLVIIPLCFSQVYASFMDQTLTVDWLYPSTGEILLSYTITVGPGVELPFDSIDYARDMSIDVGDDFILFSFSMANFFQNSEVNGFRFTDTFGTVTDITGYDIGAVSTGITGLEASDLSFTSESVFGNFGTSSNVNVGSAGDYIRLDVNFTPIPEPTTILLLGSGILGFVGFRRKLKKR